MALVKITLNMGGEIDQIDAEIERLKAQKQKRQNAINRLREYLKVNMEATGINKIECPLFSITLAKPRPKVEIVDEDALPNEYVRVKTVIEPDKPKILADLKAGKPVEGARLGESERGLTIT